MEVFRVGSVGGVIAGSGGLASLVVARPAIKGDRLHENRITVAF